ncbi:unnamed protein product [Thelazia callipaeda]|uniref:EGF-like domain-containing protein n=1 Tax=Thelazia callipaeda TaxID=103827 RepID=A0A0N5CXZ4_THECL|nr:unnamed protein product [Thelazia callipaeda]
MLRILAQTINNIRDESTTTLSPDQLACTQYEYAEAERLVSNPWCTCPPGQMPSSDSNACQRIYLTSQFLIDAVTVSTFGVDLEYFCGGVVPNPEQRSRLAILMLNRAKLPYQMCVRRDGNPIMVQLDCLQCSVEELENAFQQNAADHYVPFHVTELSLGACLASTLNDCDPEHADCVVDGPRYQCRCHEGWNDTSKDIGKKEGRRCQKISAHTEQCIIFLGYCLLWWFLLLGIILFLILPLLGCLSLWLYKWYLRRRERVSVDEQV